MSSTYGNATIHFFGAPRPCPNCTNPANVLLPRDKVKALLEEVRRLTHPDVCANPKATEVTAQVNACLDRLKRVP